LLCTLVTNSDQQSVFLRLSEMQYGLHITELSVAKAVGSMLLVNIILTGLGLY